MTIQKPLRLFLRCGPALLLCAVVGLLGCGGSQGTVSGTVTYQGAPLTAGTVTFYGKDDKSASGSIDPNGKYTVTKVPVGLAKIAVVTPPAIPDDKAKGVPHVEGATAVKPVEVPVKYSDPNQSGLTYTVTSGSQTHPIELK